MNDPLTTHRRNFNEFGHAHELTFSCYKRFRFLKSERTCKWLADAIEEARELHQFSLWAFVFMPEHVHLLIHPRTQEYDIGLIRQSIKAPVGQKAIEYLTIESSAWLDRITRKRGSRTERLFWMSGGGYDRNVSEPATLLTMIDYIHMNPVRRGLVERPEEFRWSSACWYLESRRPPLAPDWLPPEWLDQAR
jgi:putative transposase